MIFEADAEQIARLTSLQLVELMKRLLHAECRLADIPLRAATVPLQITVSDEGEDGRVEWSGGVDNTEYLPARFCVFQAKAQNITEASIRAEILKTDKKSKRRKKKAVNLNPAVAAALSKGGAYVVFCSKPFTGRKIEKLERAIRSTIKSARRNPSRAVTLAIYDANRIADWVNAHPAVALWLVVLQRRRALAGFMSHTFWARAPEVHEVAWVADDMPRFAPENVVIEEKERKDKSRNAWIFQQAAQAVSEFMAQDIAILRVVGPSGFGKSRFAFELFNRRESVADETDRSALIYADLDIAGDEVSKLALEIADAGAPAILVVDECPDEVHTKLASIARRSGSRLRLVTIDVETKVIRAADTLVLRLEPAANQTIASIARLVAPKLSDSEARFIEQLAKGFPKMAVLAADEEGVGAKTLRSVEQLVDRVVWGRRQRDEEAERAIETLSLFDWVGLTGRVAEEAALVAERLGRMTSSSFIEHVRSFKSRGIVQERGDYAQVTPIPLAASLGVRRLSLIPSEALVQFFTDAPPRLKDSLLRRLRWLDTSAEAKRFAHTLLHPDRLGNLAALNTDFGAECLDRLVHVDPDFAMATVERLVGKLSIEQLGDVRAGRRHLIWALEKLVFRKQSFEPAATLMRRLAARETEDRISNNATGQFTQLYQLYLSGTEAPPTDRLRVLDEGLRSTDSKEREVCLEALGTMLDTGHFSRSGGAEEIGTQEHLKDWAPKTYGEVWNFLRAGIKRLTDIALADDPLAVRAKNMLGSHLRGLIGQLPLEEIKALVTSIASRYGLWLEAIQELNEWLYFDGRKRGADFRKAVREYFEELMPSDPVDLAALYTQGWAADIHDPDTDYKKEEQSKHDFDYAARKATELADVISADAPSMERLLDRFTTSDAKTVFPLARRLGEIAAEPVELFKAAVTKLEQKSLPPNRGFFAGLIAGADARDPTAARECVRIALRAKALKPHAISFIGAGRLQATDISLVVDLLHAGDIEPWECAPLSYGRGMDHLTVAEIIPLLEELSQHGGQGRWTVLDIVVMLLHGGKEPEPPLVDVLRNVLLDSALFEGNRRSTNGHALEVVIKGLSRRKLIDRKFARALTRQLFSICSVTNHDVFHALDDSIGTAIKKLSEAHPAEVWAAAARLLQTKDWAIRHRFEQLVAPSHRDHLEAGLLFDLPSELYLEWARKDPQHRSAMIVDWLPIAAKNEEGVFSWHPAVEAFVEEFGDHPKALAAIASRLQPTSWWGSLEHHLRPFLPLFDQWLNHKHAGVRSFARSTIEWINSEILDARKREDEDAVRFG